MGSERSERDSLRCRDLKILHTVLVYMEIYETPKSLWRRQ